MAVDWDGSSAKFTFHPNGKGDVTGSYSQPIFHWDNIKVDYGYRSNHLIWNYLNDLTLEGYYKYYCLHLIRERRTIHIRYYF